MAVCDHPVARRSPGRLFAGQVAAVLTAVMLRRGAALGAAIALVAVAFAAPASAHANLVRASPADGATVARAPGRVTLAFDEKLWGQAVIRVTGPGAQRVSHGTARVEDNTASARVSVQRAGAYTVAFRVLSADGHSNAGRMRFTYRPAGASGPATTAPSTPAAQVGKAQHRGEPAGTSTEMMAGGAALVALLAGVGLLTARGRVGGRPAGTRRKPG